MDRHITQSQLVDEWIRSQKAHDGIVSANNLEVLKSASVTLVKAPAFSTPRESEADQYRRLKFDDWDKW